jgi:hypothetical protein
MRVPLAGRTAALDAGRVNAELDAAGRATLLAPLLAISSRFLVSRFLSSGLSRKLSLSSCSAISSNERAGICCLGGSEVARDFDGTFFDVNSVMAFRMASFVFAFSVSCALTCFVIVVFLTCRTFGLVGIGGFSGCRSVGSSLFACAAWPSRIVISALISSPFELDAAGATMTVCLGSFGFDPMLRLREGALGGARDGRILSTGALDGRIREIGALDGRILSTGALDGRIRVGSGWLLNSLGSVCISACIASSLGDACLTAIRLSFFAMAISTGERERGIRIDACGAGACATSVFCDCNVAMRFL